LSYKKIPWIKLKVITVPLKVFSTRKRIAPCFEKLSLCPRRIPEEELQVTVSRRLRLDTSPSCICTSTDFQTPKGNTVHERNMIMCVLTFS
jgi:hypothetical protein